MNIEINNLEDALNKFNKEQLSEELDNYITSKCLTNITKSKIITIKCNLSTKEKEILKNTIHSHYTNLANGLKRIDKYDDYIRLVLLIVGIILILISQETISFLSELFLITGWLFIWEMLYDVLFNQIKRKRSANIYKRLSKCEINFTN